jgi:hypothetical protein
MLGNRVFPVARTVRIPISAVDAPFLSGASATNGTAPQAFFRTVWAAGFTQPSNAPGTYSLPVVFTLSAP